MLLGSIMVLLIYTRFQTDHWVHQQHIENPEPDNINHADFFGHDIAMNSGYLAVGSLGDNVSDGGTETGSTYIFTEAL